MQTIHVLNKGQVVIPAPLRQRYGIQPGNSMEIRDAGDHLELYPLPADPVAAFRGSLKQNASLADWLIEEHKQEVERDSSG
ncbi:MAG: AbrB/MazE/SpoVT family DNA-binding domain-containing protein [Methylococcales bacterium]